MMKSAVYEAVVGKKIVGFELVDEEAVARLLFEDGSTLQIALDADCCSRSYFTNLEQFKELVGAVVRSVEERDEWNKGLPEDFKPYNLENTDCLSWHFLVFTTDKGHVTLDWRNDSNGYYDGWVNASLQ